MSMYKLSLYIIANGTKDRFKMKSRRSDNSYRYDMERDVKIKIILIGDLRVGKTTLLHRYITGEYNSQLKQGEGLGALVKRVERHGFNIQIRLWDTAGQERFRSLTSSHYRDAQGCLLVFDVTQASSFDNVIHWYDDLLEKSVTPPKLVLVGTKCHMPREVSQERAEKLAESLEIPYMEASSEFGLNVSEAFEYLIEHILENLQQKSLPVTTLHKETEEDEEKWKCTCAC